MIRFYQILGFGSILFLSAFHFLGWTFSDTEEVKGVPKSVRDNPGAYRTHYFGGK
jgi:hypothetical protein